MERNSGTFALMSSTAGKAGVPYSGSYTGSKHALHGYFESLRTEKMAAGITVTMLCPGPTFSNLLAGAATEKSGEVSYLDSWLCHKVGTLVKFQVTQPIQMKPISKLCHFLNEDV